LPQSTACASGEIEVLGVSQVQWPEDGTERIGSLRNAYQVDVVRHEAIGQSLQTVLCGIFQQELNIALPIGLFEKNILSSITPLSDVMGYSRYYSSRNSWHEAILLTAPSADNRKMGCVPIFLI
jgi:hypothetical protein